MKKTLKWLGIIFAVLIAIGILFPSEPGESPNIDNQEGGLEVTQDFATTAEANESGESTTFEETKDTESTKDTTIPTATQTPLQTPPEKSSFNIHFIDVGQADAALVECDGHYMLIDGGNKADSNVIYSVLKKTAVPKLDIVVGTHAHEDHIGGLPGAFNYTSADLTLCPVKSYDSNAFKDFVKYAEQKGNGITVPKPGDAYVLGSATVKILGLNGGSDTNDTSIILRIDYGETSFLFTGDAERDAEQAVLNRGVDLSATVLKVGHHGSDTSTSYVFLREIMPQYAVISVGNGNNYGHPTEETLSRLRDADVKVYRTDMQGDIFCTSDGKSVSFTVTKNASADVFGGIGENSTSQSAPADATTPTADSSAEPEENMVWIPKSGKKYHSHSGCSNMKDPSQVTKEEAEDRGYTPCKKCW